MSRSRGRAGGVGRGCRTAGAAGRAVDAGRAVRAVVIAAVCVVMTALGHTLMSGDVLPWWAVAAAVAGSLSGAWWLTGRERRAGVVVGATVAAQGALHVLFSVTHCLVRGSAVAQPAHVGHGALPAPSDTAGRHAAHLLGAGRTSGAVERAPEMTLLSALTHGASAGMLLAHLLAAVVCGLWVWRGEAAVHRAGRALAAAVLAPLRRVCRVLLRPASAAGPRSRRAWGGDRGHRPAAVTWALRHSVVRRGPPRAGTAPRHLSLLAPPGALRF